MRPPSRREVRNTNHGRRRANPRFLGTEPTELRAAQGGALRVLDMTDRRRTAIVLLGGDKSGEWNTWYETAIPTADDLCDAYLTELRNEGLI